MMSLESLIEHFKTIHPDLENYVSIVEDKLLFVEDIENSCSWIRASCYNSYNSEKRVLWIDNPHQKKLCFIPIDGKKGLLHKEGTSHCDAIIFDTKTICFLELKQNVISNVERAIRKKRKSAQKQLVNTIYYFQFKLNNNFLGLKVEAHISTPYFLYPRNSANWNEMANEFLETYGVPLFETVKKEFD